MLRFVVRPFGHLVGLPSEGSRLIPAPLDAAMEYPEVQINSNHKKLSLFQIRFLDGTEDNPNLTARDFRGPANIEESYVRRILASKKSLWEKSGLITHTDSHYLAALILRHPKFGKAISQLVARRFPVILVDELQDTGWFLGHALLELLRVPSVTGFLVGDPDQAIYEFGGARPTIFNDVGNLNGAVCYTMTKTHRCPKRIAAISSALSDSGSIVSSRDDAEEGQAIMIVHEMTKATLDEKLSVHLAEACQENESLAIIARRVVTIRGLMGGSAGNDFKGASHAGRRLDNAMRLFCSGQSSMASRIVAKELSWLVLKNESPTNEELRDNNIDIREWKNALYTILQSVCCYYDEENWNSWLKRVQKVIRDSAVKFNWEENKRELSGRFRSSEEGDAKRISAVASNTNAGIRNMAIIKTIHQVKGDEFDCVVLFVPKPHSKNAPCPSEEWWPTSSSEERRIAFVAASRAKKTLIMCVHRNTYDALKKKRPKFVALFNQVRII
jgi:DNA helicase-2/ATP-dependent DNA helicase PcrA